MSNVPSFETTACDEIVRIDRLLQSLRERAEKAERERDEAKEEVKQWRLGRARACACVSCEGPLTCAKCVPVKPPGIALFDDPNIVRTVLDDIDDHDARIKELADKCDSLLGRVQLLEGKTRNLGGDGKWHVDSGLTKTGPAGCKRCGGARKSFQVYCGAACAAEVGA